MYHVIAAPPPGAPFPGLYVTPSEFAAQMQALKNAGWHAVTLDQVKDYWTKGVPLGVGKPIVLSFDNGYQSQYTQALPVLRRLGWVGVENIQLTGLPPSQGGLSQVQVQFGSTCCAAVHIEIGNSSDPSSENGFTRVASASNAAVITNFKVTSAARGRYVMIWFTSLPPMAGSPNQYEAQVYNVVVRGSS